MNALFIPNGLIGGGISIGIPWHSVNALISASDLREQIPWSVEDFYNPEIPVEADGRNVLVGIVDTGIDQIHAGQNGDLYGAIEEARDFTGSRYQHWDRNGHGTHVAGIIGARFGNGRGVTGVAPACKLVIAKALGDGGSGSDAGIANAIDWLVARGCKIINLSLGSRSRSPLITGAIDRAQSAGVLVIVASGNDGTNRLNYPGRELNNVSVGAVDRHGVIAPFSNYELNLLDIAAPGVAVTSTYTDGGYADLNGTSMATPWIAGLFARRISVDPKFDLSVEHAREWLAKICDDAGEPGKDARYGFGLANVKRAHATNGGGGGSQNGVDWEYGPIHSPARPGALIGIF